MACGRPDALWTFAITTSLLTATTPVAASANDRQESEPGSFLPLRQQTQRTRVRECQMQNAECTNVTGTTTFVFQPASQPWRREVYRYKRKQRGMLRCRWSLDGNPISPIYLQPLCVSRVGGSSVAMVTGANQPEVTSHYSVDTPDWCILCTGCSSNAH
eukprot:gene2125-5166_t